MSNDRVSRSGPSAEYSAPATPAPAMYCSECKAILRLSYFSLDGRPLCTKCSSAYRARIERGTGPEAMSRAVLYGAGAAVVGMIGVAVVLSIFNAFRIISAICVGYLVAKAIGKATGNYGGRRYQILAVSLTYVALGLGMVFPVMLAAHRLDTVVAPPKREARYGPAGETAEIDDAVRGMQAEPREGEDPAVAAARADSLERADSIARVERTRANYKAMDKNAAMADRLEGGVGAKIVGAVVLLCILPLVSSFAFGLYAGVFGLLALGYGLKKAWELTEIVMDFQLTGPYKVGQGPIPPAFGG
ncbi:MAG TPA: hypothetical protein VF761_16010 [Gemmatimonadaceae bacterium]